MGNRSDQKARTRQQIMDSALALLADNRSFGELSLREVTREAGIAPNSFYRHFFDMEDLGLTLVSIAGEGLTQFISDARKRVAEPKNRVRISIEAFFQHVTENPQLFHMVLRERAGSDSFRRAIRNTISYAIEEMAEGLDRNAERTGRANFNSHLTAEAIVTVVFGLGANALETDKGGQEAIAERMIQEIELILLGSERMAELTA
jgi:AcrR family transcriptional regulator